MVIEACFPDGDNDGILERSLDEIGKVRRPGRCLVRMNARRRRQAQLGCECDRALSGRSGIGNYHNLPDPGGVRAIDYG